MRKNVGAHNVRPISPKAKSVGNDALVVPLFPLAPIYCLLNCRGELRSPTPSPPCRFAAFPLVYEGDENGEESCPPC